MSPYVLSASGSRGLAARRCCSSTMNAGGWPVAVSAAAARGAGADAVLAACDGSTDGSPAGRLSTVSRSAAPAAAIVASRMTRFTWGFMLYLTPGREVWDTAGASPLRLVTLVEDRRNDTREWRGGEGPPASPPELRFYKLL